MAIDWRILTEKFAPGMNVYNTRALGIEQQKLDMLRQEASAKQSAAERAMQAANVIRERTRGVTDPAKIATIVGGVSTEFADVPGVQNYYDTLTDAYTKANKDQRESIEQNVRDMNSIYIQAYSLPLEERSQFIFETTGKEVPNEQLTNQVLSGLVRSGEAALGKQPSSDIQEAMAANVPVERWEEFFKSKTPTGARIEIKSEEEGIKYSFDQLKDATQTRSAAEKTKANVQIFQNLLEDIDTGALTPIGIEVAKYLASAGIKPSENITRLSGALAVSKQLVLDSLAPLKGPITEKEWPKVEQSVLQVTDTKEARKIMASVMNQAADRAIHKQRMMAEFMSENNNNLMPVGKDSFYKVWDDYTEANPVKIPKAAPSYSKYKKAYLEKRPGTPESQIKQDYGMLYESE